MALKLLLERRAVAFLDDLPAKQFRQIVLKVFALLKDPEAQDTKQLVGYSYRRADVGECRIVYRVDGEDLKVILIGKRNDDEVYKQLKRL